MKNMSFADIWKWNEQFLKKTEKEKQLKKEGNLLFLKSIVFLFLYWTVAVAILLFLFQIILPIIVFSWTFVFAIALIVSWRMSHQIVKDDLQKKIIEYNQSLAQGKDS